MVEQGRKWAGEKLGNPDDLEARDVSACGARGVGADISRSSGIVRMPLTLALSQRERG
jgi:hypothetical protein